MRYSVLHPAHAQTHRRVVLFVVVDNPASVVALAPLCVGVCSCIIPRYLHALASKER